jgi:hypothetical protein
MIADPARTVVLSSLGWVEGDAIWCFEVASGSARSIAMNTGARYASLHSSNNERFVVIHHFDGAKFMASVSLFSAPELTVSSISYEDGRSFCGGNTDAWNGMPALFVEYLKAPWNDYVLVKIDSGHAQIHRLEWYDSSYDKDYQAVADVVELPDSRHALISVQRSSELVLHDLETGQARAKIGLGGSLGNPKLAVRNTEVWASDYDTMVVVDAASWRLLKKKRLQGGGQFVGDYSFTSDGACCVARPFSGDVVGVDERLRIVKTAKLGRQPLEAVELPGGNVIARDWKTGELLMGRMEQRSWLQGLFG